MNRSFNKSQPLRNADSNAVEVKSKVSVAGWSFVGSKWGFEKKTQSSHGRPVTELEPVGPTQTGVSSLAFPNTGAERTAFCVFLYFAVITLFVSTLQI